MNHDNSPYLSRPTSYARYGVHSDNDTNAYPSAHYSSSNRDIYGYGYGQTGLRIPSENRELTLDRWSSTRRGHGDGNRFPSLGNRTFGLDHPWSSFQDHSARTTSPSQYISFEEMPTTTTRPSSQTRIPINPPSVSRILPQVVVIGSNMSNRSSPRLAFSHRLTPRLSFHQEMTPPDTDDESKLTKEEQEQVLRKLKKEIYKPAPTNVVQRRQVCLYYRDLNHNPSYLRDNKKLNEEGKSCAICLEDFQAEEEVMLTPCNHMFHEECIVPWAKSHGQCPLCRSLFCHRLKENASRNGNRPPPLHVAHSLFDGELVSLIQAVNEAFPWGS